MITCRELIDFLMNYLEDQLSAADRAEFDRHLSVCPDCVHYVAMYASTVKIGRAVFTEPDRPVPDDIPEDLVQAILKSRRQLQH